VSTGFRRGRKRDGEEFARFYDEQIWRVYGFLAYRLGSREEAEDLTQQTFENAFRAWARFDERKASASTWVIVIARNLLIDYHRRDRSARQVPLEESADQLDHESGALAMTTPEDRMLGLSPEIEAVLGQLTQRERELIALRFGADLSGPLIAGLTGLSLANVQQILSRSLRKMRAQLEERAPGGAPTD
jgi:RNA polymerase sigma-70 factor, ECF subfamily